MFRLHKCVLNKQVNASTLGTQTSTTTICRVQRNTIHAANITKKTKSNARSAGPPQRSPSTPRRSSSKLRGTNTKRSSKYESDTRPPRASQQSLPLNKQRITPENINQFQEYTTRYQIKNAGKLKQQQKEEQPKSKALDLRKISNNFRSQEDDLFGKEPFTFQDLKLPKEITNAVLNAFPDVKKPTMIQQQAIPFQMKLHNVAFASQTGSGKTLAYLLPLISHLRRDELDSKVGIIGKVTNMCARRPGHPRALILLPNRELASQVAQIATKLSHHTKFSTLNMAGGENSAALQKKIIMNDPIDLVVSTPGRLLDFRERDFTRFLDVRNVVIDEADTMFGKGFVEDVFKVIAPIKGRRPDAFNYYRQTQFVMVSATLTDDVKLNIKRYFGDVEFVETAHLHQSLAKLDQRFLLVDTGDKFPTLLDALRLYPDSKRVMVFCNTVDSCRAVEHYLRENNFRTACYHGDLMPKRRDAYWNSFVSGEANVMVCTDIASRGLDTRMVDHVVMFDFPLNVVDYLHRVGRTARAGDLGRATSIVAKRDRILAAAIQKATKSGTSLEKLTADRKDYLTGPLKGFLGPDETVSNLMRLQPATLHKALPLPK